jgi:hypothetical protein
MSSLEKGDHRTPRSNLSSPGRGICERARKSHNRQLAKIYRDFGHVFRGGQHYVDDFTNPMATNVRQRGAAIAGHELPGWTVVKSDLLDERRLNPCQWHGFDREYDLAFENRNPL